MAGQGIRFGDPLPKQFHLLSGKKVYRWALEALLSSLLFEEILLVVPPLFLEEVKQEIGDIRVVPGGKTRQESSYKGLIACGSNTHIVVIHDGVRPFVSKRILEENVQAAQKYGAVDTCIPSTDTLVYAPGKKKILSIPSRSDYLRGQTPQSFSYPLILEAHEKTLSTHATDDCQLILEQGKEVFVIEGEEENLKITTSSDFFIAEKLLEKGLVCSGIKGFNSNGV